MYPDTSPEAAQNQLEPYHQQLYDIFTRAVERLNSIPPELLLPLVRFNRSRSTCVWAYAMDELLRTFPPEGPVKLVTKYETIEIHFGPNLVARLKKMTPAGFTSNYQTKRVKAFHGGDQQGELFVLSWAKPLRLDIGYVPNETGTGVEQVLVARRKSAALMDWFYAIRGPDSGSPIPIERNPSPSDDAAKIEVRKSEVKQLESKGESA